MKRNEGVVKNKSKKLLDKINHHAAGIDLSPKENWVCVPPEFTEVNVRRFGSSTADFRKIVAWLKECGVTTVAMESTGVYWIPLREILERAGFEVVQVHAQFVKAVPGRKTDVLDCQWLQELHSYGLLHGAYRPPDELLPLRTYTRERSKLVKQSSRDLLQMQKALDQMNVLVIDPPLPHTPVRLGEHPLYGKPEKQERPVKVKKDNAETRGQPRGHGKPPINGWVFPQPRRLGRAL